jgi:ABC-type polysaccharide/polyol phosphate transport system ATPase subunit
MRGETVGIIGRNGSGKSTLLQLICGTLNPTSGSVQNNGRIAALLELGSGFNPEFTGRENVYMNGTVLGLTIAEIETRFDDIETFADIGTFIDQPVKTYSSGMLVRLAFAVQAHVDPDVLIVDEALGVGDVFFQQKCARFMRDKLAGCTKLLVTHDMQAIHNFCSRVLVLEDGRVVFSGPARRGIEAYLRSNHSKSFRDANLEKSSVVRSDEVIATLPKFLVSQDSLGGRKGVFFESFSLSINDEWCAAESAAVFSGDRIEIKMNLSVMEPLEDLILGYLLVDRNGMHVCGDNSLSINILCSAITENLATATLIFNWPSIADGAYTLTLGIGRGRDPLNHIIECWAHSVYAFQSISHAPIHGLFNNKIIEANFKDGIG